MPKCKLFGGTVTKPAKRVSAARRRSKSVTVQSTSDLLHKMGLPSATDRADSQHRPGGFRRPGYMQPTKAASSKKFNRSVYILSSLGAISNWDVCPCGFLLSSDKRIIDTPWCYCQFVVKKLASAQGQLWAM